MTFLGLQSSKRKLYALASLVFLSVMGWFLYCAAPTLYWGDSAEMASVACSLGVPHSPGYPLFSVFMRPFTWLPVSPAFGLNVMGVFLAAAAAALLLLFLRDITRSLFAALAGAALLVSIPSFAFHSLAIDVYPLHMVLFGALLYCTGRHEETDDVRWFLGALAAVSLGMAHHILMYFVFVSYLAYCALRVGHVQRVAGVPLLLFFGLSMYNLLVSHDLAAELRVWYLAGLGSIAVAYVVYLVFLGVKRAAAFRTSMAVLGAGLFVFAAATFLFAYLPMASARGPVADWWSPDTPAKFLNLLFLKGYPPTFPDTTIELMRRVDLGGFVTQTSILVLIVAAVGAAVMFVRRTYLALLLLLAGAMTLAGTLLVQHGKPEALRLPVYLILIIIAAWLIGWLLRGATRGLGLFYIITGILVGAAVPVLAIFAPRLMETRIMWVMIGVAAFNILWGTVFWKWNKRLLLLAPWYVAFTALVVFCFAKPQLADMRVLAHSGGAYELGDRIIADTGQGGILFIGSQTPGIMAYFQSCEAEKIQKKKIAVIPVSFLGFDWKIEQLRRAYPDVYFPVREIKGDGKDQIFSTRGAGHLSYAQRMIAGNSAERGFYSDFEFIPFEMGYATVPHGAVNKIIAGDSLEAMQAAAAEDKRPRWRNVSVKDLVEAENIASVHSQRGHLYLLLGVLFEQDSLFKKSCGESSRAVEICPTCAAGYVNRGACKWYQGDEEAAIRDMEYAVFTLHPEDPLVYNVYAETLLRRHTVPALERAIGIFQISLQLDPEQPRVYSNLGTAFTMSGRKDAAIAMYQKAIEQEPGYIEVYRALSRLHESMGDCARSVGYLEDARDYLKKSGRDANAGLQSLDVNMELAIRYHSCGWRQLFLDQMQEAYKTFRQPDGGYTLDFFQAVGTTFREIGRVDIAARIYGQARQLYPEYRLFDMYESLRYADCAQSIPLLQRALMLSPANFSLRVGYASILGACHLPVDAQRQLRAAKAIDPGEKGVDALLGELYKSTSGIKIKGDAARYKIDIFTGGKVNLDSAILFYETALAEDGGQGRDAPEIMRALADLYRDTGQCDEAVDLMEQATSSPDSISMQTRYIRILAACGRNEDIAYALKTLFEGFEKDYVFYLETGTLFRDLGHTEKAVELYREFSQVLPD